MSEWVIITGASSGIGRAVATRFLKDGYGVVAVARRGARLQELADRFGADHVQVETIDVRDTRAVAAMVDRQDDAGHQVVALVNNAGLSLGLGPLDEGDPDDWETMIATNISGLLSGTRAVLPRMREAGRGHVINIGSLAGGYAFFGGNVYGATKAFVHHLSANLRVDLSGSGVRITCIAPGMVRSEFAEVRFDGDLERVDRLYHDITPLTPEDVADAVRWAFHTPAHVNVNYLELMPVSQPFGLAFGRVPVRTDPS